MLTHSQATTTSNGGIGFLGLLTLVLVVLKATGHLAISWWLVFLPVWGPIVVLLVLFALFGAFLGAAHLIEKRSRRRRR